MATDTLRPMRRVASLFALGLMMALFHRVTAGAPLEARATLALGFLLLVAYVGGEIARRVRLPRLTGYLLVGFAVGPAWLGLVQREEVDALRFIEEAAVALIGLAAGSELTLDALRRGRVALARLASGAIVFPLLAVSLVVLSVSPWFPLTRHQPLGDALVVALVLGTLAAASSPAVTMAMMSELEAHGPVARALLGITVVKDVAVALLFALVLALGKALTSAGALNVAVAGAGLRVGVLADLWPWILLLVGLRLVGLRYGLLWAGRHSSVTPVLARHGWLGLISQAGMALGLAQLARRAFPEWGVSLETLIVAMIGVHEVAGPICFRTALVRAGEVTEGSRDVEEFVGDGPIVARRGGV